MADMAAPHNDGHKVFVGNLPGDCSTEELQTVFGTYGEVTKLQLMDPHARSGQRCALVFYSKIESAEDAIKVLDGVYKIREDAPTPIKVSWARGSGPEAGKGDGRNDADGFKLFVGGLPVDCTEAELQTVFSTYGEVVRAHVMQPHAQTGRVAAFVYYSKAESAEDAIKVLDKIYKIREDAEAPIEVRWAQDKKGKGKGKDEWGGGASGGQWGGKGGWGPEPTQTRDSDGFKVFVGGLPLDVTQDELRTVFSTYGEVNKVHVMQPNGAGNRIAAFVFYQRGESAEDAIKVLNGVYKIREDADMPIVVKWGQDKAKGGEKGWTDGKGGKVGGWSGGGCGGCGWDGGKGKGGQPALGWGCGTGGWQDKGGGGGWGKGGGGGWQDRSGGGWQDRSGWQGGGCGGWQDDRSGVWGGGGWDAGKGGKGGSFQGGKDAGKGELSDTRLFVGNLPEDITEDALRYVFNSYGTVQNVHVMSGKSKTGQSCAFVEYAQRDQAEVAILTLHDKYEIRPGHGPISVKKANAKPRAKPY